MQTPPDGSSPAAQVVAIVGHAGRRIAVADAMRAATAGLLGCAVILALARPAISAHGGLIAGASLGGAAIAAVIWRRGALRRTPRGAAGLIEASHPFLRNLAVTAEELIAEPGRVPAYMRDRVIGSAARAMTRVEISRVVPLRSGRLAAAAAAVAVVFTLPIFRAAQPAHGAQAAGRPPSSAAAAITIDVTSPLYTARPLRHLRDPASIEAIAGSTAVIRVTGAGAAAVRLNGVPLPIDASGEARATLLGSGSIGVEGVGLHALVPLTVVPDAAPAVRISEPARDLRVPVSMKEVRVRAEATDDFGLRELALRYTVVSGTGEEFAFTEGTLPASIAKASDRAWSAEATLPLAALKLGPGDVLVYRGVAADARPGAAGEATSETYFVEIAGPGDVPLEGIDMPPERARYALSQAMIVLKIQRLIAEERRGMPRAQVGETAAAIAAEQRAVRANFVFMLGGEVEDEVVEAEASHEIQEGRLANQARRDIVAATELMTTVEQALAGVDTRAALPPAQEAVRALQRAFGHARYLLRALPARIRIDPARRLSGDIAGVRGWQRELAPPAGDARTDTARAALADLADIAASLDAGASDRLGRLAERVIAIEPGAADVQQASRQLTGARAALARGDLARAREALRAAAPPLATRAQRGRLDAAPIDAETARLAGAAALQGGGR
jgi:hypothetical protein